MVLNPHFYLLQVIITQKLFYYYDLQYCSLFRCWNNCSKFVPGACFNFTVASFSRLFLPNNPF